MIRRPSNNLHEKIIIKPLYEIHKMARLLVDYNPIGAYPDFDAQLYDVLCKDKTILSLKTSSSADAFILFYNNIKEGSKLEIASMAGQEFQPKNRVLQIVNISIGITAGAYYKTYAYWLHDRSTNKVTIVPEKYIETL